ncbi:RidA family protein [Aggregatilineales bacterium SYSU G02658]
MKEIISTTNAPSAVGPYSQAVRVGDWVFTSGQLGLDPQTMQLVEGVQAQTRQALTNLKAILESQGLTLDHVVKTTVFLQHMGDFAAMNEVYATFFPSHPPARSTVEVAKLPLGGLVEVEAIAHE